VVGFDMFFGPVEGSLVRADADLSFPSSWVQARAGDVDGDGHRDAITNDSSAVVLHAGPTLVDTFVAFREVGHWVYPYAVGDTDGDGFEDLLVVSRLADPHASVGSTYVLLGPITSELGPGDAVVAWDYVGGHGLIHWQAAGLTTGDVDNDGCDDILYPLWGTGWSAVLLGPIHADTTPEDAVDRVEAPREATEHGESWRSDATSIGVEDLTGDGVPDLVVRWRVGGGDAFVWRGPIEGAVPSARAVSRLSGGEAGPLDGLDFADLDADGKPDVLVPGLAYFGAGLWP
jgi:hypothetical protein